MCMLLLFLIISVVSYSFGDPQTAFLGEGCSTYNVTSDSTFTANLNATFSDIKSDISNGSRFSTSSHLTGSDPVYAMLQCRDYVATADCLSCFSSASVLLRNCSSRGANGGRVILDGCFLRYERNMFYGEGTTDANRGLCSANSTSIAPSNEFSGVVEGLLSDLQMAAPVTRGFFAVSAREVPGATQKNASVYGVAQCVHTIDRDGCAACLKTAYANVQRCPPTSAGRAIDSGCFMRYADSPFFSPNQSMNLADLLKTGSSSKAPLIGGIAGGCAAVVLIVAAIFTWFRVMRKTDTPRGDLLEATELRGPVNYRYKDLITATGNFKEGNKLGEGGFGEVYKGTLKNGKIVAVKKMTLSKSRRAQADFVSEVTLISNVHHRNLVRLLGCCSKGPELLLVYEFMPNKSLDRHLFGPQRNLLTWRNRFDIILGTAQGLAYLHEQFHVCIVHRDIKPSNILLDHEFQPKIADFGLVRLLPDNQTHVSTNFAGTLGYTAPEYAVHGHLSEKADAYGYGVVVLEIVSGSRCTDVDRVEAEYLLKRAWRLYESRTHVELLDKTVSDGADAEEVKKVIEIALMCTQTSPSLRPTMSDVAVMLKHTGPWVSRSLTSPPFIDTFQRLPPDDRSASTASSASLATLTVTQVSCR